MAPVGSETTPVMGGVEAGVEPVGLAAKRNAGARKRARAKARSIGVSKAKFASYRPPKRRPKARAKRFTTRQSANCRPATACSRPNQKGEDRLRHGVRNPDNAANESGKMC